MDNQPKRRPRFCSRQLGSLTSFSVPLRNLGTLPNDSNDGGQITGFYVDGNAASHGFVQ
jgi:hypothetical protein